MRFSRHFERFQGIKPFLHYLMPSRFRQSNATHLKARVGFPLFYPIRLQNVVCVNFGFCLQTTLETHSKR